MRVTGTEPVGQEQRAFFMIAFMQGVLRPSLLLFGLAISTYVFSAISAVLNATFNLGVASAVGNGVIGPVGIVVICLLLFFVQWQLCVRSIHLISTVPEAVTEIVGGGLGRLGSVESHVSNVYGMISMGARSSLSNVWAQLGNDRQRNATPRSDPAEGDGETKIGRNKT